MSTHTFLRLTAPLNNCFCRETAAELDLVGKDGVSWADRSVLASRSTIRACKKMMLIIDKGVVQGSGVNIKA